MNENNGEEWGDVSEDDVKDPRDLLLPVPVVPKSTAQLRREYYAKLAEGEK